MNKFKDKDWWLGKIKGWSQRHPFTLAILAFLAGAMIVTGAVSSEDKLTQGEIKELEDRVEQLISEKDDLFVEQRDLQNELYALRDTANEAKDTLEAAEATLEKKEKKQQRQKAQSTIDDGIWQAGKDFEPGTYRAPAGSDCYWAILNSPNNDDIDNNGGFTANQTVQVSQGKWFETSDCGTWKKLG